MNIAAETETAGRQRLLRSLAEPSVRKDLVRIVSEVLKYPHRLPGCESRTGFVLSMYFRSSCGIWVTVQVDYGELSPDKGSKYSDLSQEKCWRTRMHPAHISSRQSADPDRMQYPGAIRVRGGYIGISGLTADMDEAGVTASALSARLISSERAQRIMTAGTPSNAHPGLVYPLLDTTYAS